MRFVSLVRVSVLSSLMLAAGLASAADPIPTGPVPSGDYVLTITTTSIVTTTPGEGLRPTAHETKLEPSHSAVLSLTGTVSGNTLVLTERGVTGGPSYTATVNPDGSFVLTGAMGGALVDLHGSRTADTMGSFRGSSTAQVKAVLDRGSFYLAFQAPLPHPMLPASSGDQQGKKHGQSSGTIGQYTGPCTGCSTTGSPPDGTGAGGAPPADPGSSTTPSPSLWSQIGAWFAGLNWGTPSNPSPTTPVKKGK